MSTIFLIISRNVEYSNQCSDRQYLDNKYCIERFEIQTYIIDVGRDDQGKIKSEVVR